MCFYRSPNAVVELLSIWSTYCYNVYYVIRENNETSLISKSAFESRYKDFVVDYDTKFDRAQGLQHLETFIHGHGPLGKLDLKDPNETR